MTITKTITINADPAAVFRLYEAVSDWPKWDTEVEAVHLPKGLVRGATGWLKPRQGPKSAIFVDEVKHGRCFTVKSRLPLCEMNFGHDIAEHNGKSMVTHWVTFVGPLSPLFRYLIGRPIAKTLPATLAGLKAECEKA